MTVLNLVNLFEYFPTIVSHSVKHCTCILKIEAYSDHDTEHAEPLWTITTHSIMSNSRRKVVPVFCLFRCLYIYVVFGIELIIIIMLVINTVSMISFLVVLNISAWRIDTLICIHVNPHNCSDF